MKKHAPATLRNREAIAQVLHDELPLSGTVLEVASGSGEHAFHFAGLYTNLDWQPSDSDPEAIASILAYLAEYEGANLRLPLILDATRPESWELREADAILCVNMAHISQWDATEGLFKGAAALLASGAPLILYGPFFEDGVEPAPSNTAFDESLRARNRSWGIRSVDALDTLAAQCGMARTGRYEMPANNLTLVYRVN